MIQSRPRIFIFARIWVFIHPASPYHPRPSGRTQGVRKKQKRGKHREKFPRAWWPRVVSEKGRSSSSSHRLPRAVKACCRTRSFHAASSPQIHARLPLFIVDLPRLAAFTTLTTWRTTTSAGVLYTNGREGCCNWRATQRRRTSTHQEAGA
jgi:hypothetical protein